jgi:3-deoxy-7-phosphoheptulonate synthase
MVDLHPEPGAALCDGPQALVDVDLKALTVAVKEMPPMLGRKLVTAP